VCAIGSCSAQLLANLRRMPVDRAGDLIETLLEAIEPCGERLRRVRSVVESGRLWQPGTFCRQWRRPDVQYCRSLPGGRAGLGRLNHPVRGGTPRALGIDLAFSRASAAGRPQSRRTPREDPLPGQHRDSSSKKYEEPDRDGKNWFQGVPFVAVPGAAAMTWRLYPRRPREGDLARPRPSCRHTESRHLGYSATLGSPASAASISDCGCS
jgi:hypothetical protein